MPPAAQDGAQDPPPHHRGDHLAAREWREVAQHSARSGTVVDGGADLHRLVAVSMNFGPLVLTNSGPPSGVQSAEPGPGRAHQVSVGSLSFPSLFGCLGALFAPGSRVAPSSYSVA